MTEPNTQYRERPDMSLPNPSCHLIANEAAMAFMGVTFIAVGGGGEPNASYAMMPTPSGQIILRPDLDPEPGGEPGRTGLEDVL